MAVRWPRPLLSSNAAADLPLKLHVTFKLRNYDALNKLLAEQQDPKSPQYHHWLTPAQFNARYGRTPAEVRAVSEWLAEHHFRVLRSTNRAIDSTVTVADAEQTFATSIAASADGAKYSNSSEPQIPARFAEVIGSIEGLDNLRHWMPIVGRPYKRVPAIPAFGKWQGSLPSASRGRGAPRSFRPRSAAPRMRAWGSVLRTSGPFTTKRHRSTVPPMGAEAIASPSSKIPTTWLPR